nr:MtnX-like HAD-IB family phosphatase [Candidatus Njordarchaeota archaeon]
MNVAILCDFDGTITDDDVAQLIFDRFGNPLWWEIEHRFRRGEISCRNALIGEFSTVRAEKKQIEDFVNENVRIKPHFDQFVETCRNKKLPVSIVSDGLDFYIDLVLKKVCLDGIRVYCNRAVFEDNKVRITFPYTNPQCDKCGNCKRLHLRRLKKNGYKIIYVGDGYSDMCAAEEADFVIAKSYLLDHCMTHKIQYAAFKDFADVVRSINLKLEELSKKEQSQAISQLNNA